MASQVCLSLIKKLADGRFHSGQKLAESLGITRAAVWKNIKCLEKMGLELNAVRGRGYQLQHALELLDEQAIRQQLHARDINDVQLDIYPQVDSTNRVLLSELEQGQSQSGHICLAESQTKGRGRRGRQWISPFAGNIFMSISWCYRLGPAVISGLSLALGVAVMRVLSPYTGLGLGLKWPNDIYYKEKKLGGILVEITGESNGPCCVVAGLGINQYLPEHTSVSIEQPWIALSQIVENETPSRNQLVSELIQQFFNVLSTFQQTGFSAYVDEWNQWDIYKNRPVTLSGVNGNLRGIASGINTDGFLLLDTGQQIETIGSGEISLRADS